MGADLIIAVDVGIWYTYENNGNGASDTSLRHRSVVPTAARQFWHALTIMMAQQVARNLQDNPPDVLVKPDVSADFVLFSGMQRVPELVAIGEQAMEQALPQLRTALDAATVTPTRETAKRTV